ncbi:hypothetical protein [Halapricum desulfuricans]|nr:hypothetical protein [Halapricum desulfuricans]
MDYDGEIRSLAQAFIRCEDLTTLSEAIDRALRIEVAAVLDQADMPLARTKFDVAYTIPPENWVAENTPQCTVDSIELVEGSDKHINAATAPVVHTILKAIIERTEYEQFDEVVRAGLHRAISLEE